MPERADKRQLGTPGSRSLGLGLVLSCSVSASADVEQAEEQDKILDITNRKSLASFQSFVLV